MRANRAWEGLAILLLAGFSSQKLLAQGDPAHDAQPVYRVTVVSRTLQAVNYEHRSGPTKIAFQGTVLLPNAKGEATVESKRGRVAVDAKFDHLDPPTKFGPEYLTYVLWAITPEGRPKNLGELVVDPSNKAKISVTTPLQALGLMVTAEPYYAVTTPSDVVVLENIIRPDTIGKVEQVTVKYDLLPRGQYTLNLTPAALHNAGAEAQKLPYDRYEAVLEIYQAQNAVQIARALGADRLAQETFSKAQALLDEAQSLEARKQDTHMIVSRAREAAQMAEDARTITLKRRDEDRLSREKQEELNESRAREKAQFRADQAQAQAEQAQAQAAEQGAATEADRAAAEQARFEADRQRAAAAQQAALAQAERNRPAPPAPFDNSARQRQSRANLLAGLNGILPTRDTPRGLVVVVPDSILETSPRVPAPPASQQLARIAALIRIYPGLGVQVEGYTDDHGGDVEDRTISQQRAQMVRNILVMNGVPSGAVMASGYGKARPIASNATAPGRQENQRVEIVIGGQAIGEQALWDRAYPLATPR